MRSFCKVIVVAGLVSPLLGGCEVAPMTYLRTFGPIADRIASLGWGLIAICSAVVIIIGALVLVASLRSSSPYAVGTAVSAPIERGGGLSWIYVGVGLSTIALLGIVVWTLFTLTVVASPDATPAFTIEIRGHQWWWEVRYIGESAGRTFTTANELHIPVGRPVRLKLIGDDVIHSFWVPALAGKTDVIPGQTNLAWIEAAKAGVYRGQCTEYCGQQHAHMAVLVVADAPEAFRSWWDAQLSPAPTPASDAAANGRSVFLARCGACHTVRGTGAGGILGPDLSHLMGRQTIAAGTLTNNPANLAGWIANAQGVKPGSQMPTLTLSGADLAAVTAYLQTLH